MYGFYWPTLYILIKMAANNNNLHKTSQGCF